VLAAVSEGLSTQAPSEGPERREASPRTIISTRGLTKRFPGGIVAVESLDLDVYHGEVYGLLGPNGAGKTTTLRMLLGLARPTAGSASVLGLAPGRPEGLRRLGALVEEPALYPYLSGRDNLLVLARYCGVDDRRVAEVLDVVELTPRAGSKLKTYSLGMRQRLGVAAALLKDPELLILDEPTNGLDPKGMAEMRELIRSLGTGERTVVLSSHLMVEVEQVCDRVGIISRGRLVAEGSVEQLRGGAILVVDAEPLALAETVAARAPGVRDVERRDGVLHVGIERDEIPELNAELVRAGVRVRELRPARQSLESVFLELTEEATVA
jgi:ABC-type multidrug transport system ATPase subunit